MAPKNSLKRVFFLETMQVLFAVHEGRLSLAARILSGTGPSLESANCLFAANVETAIIIFILQ
jgi:hypothetical protein